MARAKLGQIAVIPLSLLTIGVVIWAGKYRGNNQMAGSIGFDPTHPSPPQINRLVDPAAQNTPPSGAAAAERPVWERGVDADQARVFIEISTAASIPAFDQEVLEAPAGSVVALTFTNNAAPDTSYVHSWVLVRPGTEAAVAAQAANEPSGGFLPSHSSAILAATGALHSGESETIYFRTPPEPGEYPYFCTFPGHAQAMHGVLRIFAPH